ncbi:MAG: hypothetical protein EA349_07425 [Halomonadaceae bacterium]|nr:MAG: hypothetical protein EA349_07425 [Halomonadaceae bacterium]
MLKREHHLVSPVPEAVVIEARAVIAKIRQEGATKDNKESLYQLINKLTEEGVDFFFMEPLRRMGAGTVMKKMAKMGLSSMLKGTRMVIHNVLKKIDDKGMHDILDFIEEILYEPDTTTVSA